MSYLYDYYRGKQDIRLKDKIVRPEINNKVMINRANEIVVFKSAYLLDGPIRYVSNGGEDDISASVNTLNEYMRSESKDKMCIRDRNKILYDEDISNPPFEAVIAFKSDRVARDTKLYFYYLYVLEKRNIKLLSTQEVFPEGDFANRCV